MSTYSNFFALADALGPPWDVHLKDVPEIGEVVTMALSGKIFGLKHTRSFSALGEELEKEGYGIPEELMNRAKA